MNIRLTPHRKSILTTLACHKGTLSAAELHAKLPNVNLVTIYRNLDTLSEAGHIKKLFLSGKEAVYEYQKQPHHHAICTECDAVIHFETEATKLKEALQLKGFDITDVDITVRGTCQNKHQTSPRH